jgi:hypothetical protein
VTDDSGFDGTVPPYGVWINGDSPTVLVDLVAVEGDLSYAARLFASVADDDAPDARGDVRRAMWEAGLLAYRRAFANGWVLLAKKRPRVPPPVAEGLAPLRDEGDWIRALADQLIAHHQANASEKPRVYVVLTNPEIGRAIEGVNWMGARADGPDSDVARRASEAAGELAAGIRTIVSELAEAMLSEAKQRDLDELYHRAQPLAPPAPPPA